MVTYALLAAFGCALCNGLAAILQKRSADEAATATAVRLSWLLGLLRQGTYLAGVALDGVAWILTLVAVHSLPLFVVQPVIALSVVVTALVERLYLRRQLGRQSLMAMGIILIGLLLIASQATVETTVPTSDLARGVIIVAPVGLLIVGMVFAKVSAAYATPVIAALSGVAFGGTAIAGRLLVFGGPWSHFIFDPLFFAIVAYGLVGMSLFSIALQRHHASVVNAAMVAFETAVPVVVGLLVLGDHPRAGAWPVLVAGLVVSLSGTALLTLVHPATESI